MRAVVLMALAAGLVAGFLLGYGLGRAGNGDVPDERVQLLEPYDSSFINLWVRGCVSSGDTEAFCRCAIGEYTARLRPDEFETAAAIARSDGQLAELPENVREAVTAVERECR
jgi:hypothetical protein